MAGFSFPRPIFFLLFVFSLASVSSAEVSAADAGRYHHVNLHSLRPSATCSSPKGAHRRGLTIAHRHGPCSPLGGEKVSTGEILLRDQARVKSLQARVSNSSQPFRVQATTLPVQLGVSVGVLNYIVSVGLGTPSKALTLAFDTGSDLTWVQCLPCADGSGCYQQRDPYFNPAASSSYAKISCNSRECSELPSGTGKPTSCSSSTCYYTTSYGDGSGTQGFYARDTLVLKSDSVPSFRFGCGQKNSGLFGSADGLLGLGRDPVSLVSQTANKFSKVFSYCLPSTSSDTGFLTFGPGTAAGAKFTPLLTVSEAASFYFVEVVGILVAGKVLNIPASTFSSPGTILDSGTVISRLPPAAYSALRAAFRQAMASLNYKMVQPYQIFDTCYDFSQYETVQIPKVILRFNGGVDVDVTPTGIVYVVKPSQACLAFASNGNPGNVAIIGNRQQRAHEVIYDVGGGRIGFAAGGCS